MIRLGTVAAIGFDDFDPPVILDLYRRLGCEVLQVYRNVAAGVTLDQMRRAVASVDLPVDSLHGVYGDHCDPSDPDEAARAAAADIFRAEGELVRELGGDLVVVHCSTKLPGGAPAEERRRRIDQLKRSIDQLGRWGESIGVRYAFENLPPYHPLGADVGELAGWLRDQAAPNTGLCFDSAHAHFTADPAEAVAAGGEQIIYTHMNDNTGQADTHDLPGFGTIDWLAVARALRAAGYQGTFMLECFYPAERLRELIDQGYAERLASILAAANGRDDT